MEETLKLRHHLDKNKQRWIKHRNVQEESVVEVKRAENCSKRTL